MARKANKELENKIINSLRKHTEGTYVSEIARELKISKSSISYIINTRLKSKIQEIKIGQKGLFRIIKLK